MILISGHPATLGKTQSQIWDSQSLKPRLPLPAPGAIGAIPFSSTPPPAPRPPVTGTPPVVGKL